MLTIELPKQLGRGSGRSGAPARAPSRARRRQGGLSAGAWGSRGGRRLASCRVAAAMGAPGAERPATFVEDTAVAPERLAGFVADFQQLVAKHGVRASFTGHASAGCLHIRPLPTSRRRPGPAAGRIGPRGGRPRRDYYGAISGEHAAAARRSWFLPASPRRRAVRRHGRGQERVRPGRLLGPGTVIDGPPVTEALRYRRRLRRGRRLGAAPRLLRGRRLRLPWRSASARVSVRRPPARCARLPRRARRGAKHPGRGECPPGGAFAERSPWRRSARTSSATCGTAGLQGLQERVPAGVTWRPQGGVARAGPSRDRHASLAEVSASSADSPLSRRRSPQWSTESEGRRWCAS